MTHRKQDENVFETLPREEDTGYGKPPRSTRFKKGQSGNPKGRPKKKKEPPLQLESRSSLRFLEEEAYRPLKLTENGKPVEMPYALCQNPDQRQEQLRLYPSQGRMQNLLEPYR